MFLFEQIGASFEDVANAEISPSCLYIDSVWKGLDLSSAQQDLVKEIAGAISVTDTTKDVYAAYKKASETLYPTDPTLLSTPQKDTLERS